MTELAADGDIDINEINFSDANFRGWLQTQAYGTNNVLTAVEIASITIMDVSSKGISDLTGIGYFTALTELNCENNSLSALPELPGDLIRFTCNSNSLTALPALPNSLQALGCGDNDLTVLPTLPDSLEFLYCDNNSLTTLPHLPDTLEELDCDYNNLTELPTLPNSLTWLSCNDNRLTALTLNSNASYDHIDVSNNFMTATSAVTGQTIDWRSEDDTSGDARFAFYPQSTPSSIAPTITSASVTAFTVGMAGSFTVAASNSPASFAVSGDTLPTGIAFDTATGVLSGTPAAGMAGTYNLSFTATNGSGTSPAQSFTLTVNPVGATTYTVTINGSYAGTSGAGSYAQGATVTIDAGSRSNYSFTDWTASGVTLASPGSASTTFTMPAGAVTITANWTKNSSGGSSSGDANTAPSINVTTDKQPDMPIMAKMSVSGTLKDGILSATITEQMVKDAIKTAQDAAKKSGKEADGITVELNVICSGNYTSLNAALDAGIIDRLKEAGVKSVKIGSAVLDITLDTGAIAEIDKQSTGTVTVSARKLTKLSDAAKALIGSRPVFDITVSYQKNGKPEYVSNFGKGVVALGIAYKVAGNENKGNLFGV